MKSYADDVIFHFEADYIEHMEHLCATKNDSLDSQI